MYLTNRADPTVKTIRTEVMLAMAGTLLLLLMSGCRKDLDLDRARSLDWNPDFALALVHDSITLRKILTQNDNGDNLVIDETGDISILYYYNNQAFRLRPNDLLRVSTGSYPFGHTITTPEEAALRTGNVALPASELSLSLSGQPSDVRVDSMRIRKGTLWVHTNHTFSNDGYLVIRFPDATRNGVVLSDTIRPFNAGPSDMALPMDQVLFDLRSSPNTIRCQVTGLLEKSMTIQSGDQISAGLRVSIDTLSTFSGFLGHQVLDQLRDSVQINVFNNAYVMGNLYFFDPQVMISIVNSIGVPSEITVGHLTAVNHASVSTLDIAPYLGSGGTFQVPAAPYPSYGPVFKTVTYTNDNTGQALTDFFNLKPDAAAFQVKNTLNPAGTPLNFFCDTSSFFADLRVKLPMWGHFDHLTYQDTFDLVISKPEEFEYLALRTHIVNGMPASGLMQIYFTDDQYHKIDSLAGSDLIFIREAPVDPATYLPYPGMFGVKDTTYVLDAQRMQKMAGVTRMLLKAELFTPQNGTQDVKFRAGQSIRLDFTARARLRKAVRPWESSSDSQ